MGILIGVVHLYDYFCKRKETLEVKRISDAFSNDIGIIDMNLLEDISHAIIYRYYDQLHRLTLSTTHEVQERPDPRPGDGLFVFATAIINRIISSIIRGKNEFGSQKNEEIAVPIVERCIIALYQEKWDKESCAQSLKTELETKETSWTVGGVLDLTGINISNETGPESFYIKLGYTKHTKYGFRYVVSKKDEEEPQEVGKLHFQQSSVLPKEEKYSVKSNLPQRLINGQNRKGYSSPTRG